VHATFQPVDLEDVVFRVHGEERPTVDTTVAGDAEDLDLEDHSGVDLYGDLADELVLEQRDVRIDGIPDLLRKACLVHHGQPTDRDALDPRQGRGDGLIARRRRVHLLGAGGLDGREGVGVAGGGEGQGQGQGDGGDEEATHRNPPVMRSHDVLYYSISAASTIE